MDMNNTLELLHLAAASAHNAYAPYSRFAVGAAILSSNGNFYSGCNVENISYPVGTCAEAGAISAMINGGSRHIQEILILADGQDLITPCGACRQRIAEFATKETLVHLATPQGIQKTLPMSQLLPFCFTDKELQK